MKIQALPSLLDLAAPVAVQMSVQEDFRERFEQEPVPQTDRGEREFDTESPKPLETVVRDAISHGRNFRFPSFIRIQ